MRWVVGSSTHGCWLGHYELEKQAVVSALVKPGMKVFDVGANAGFYTLAFARLVGNHGHVWAFEPLAENVQNLRRHVALNELANVTIVQAAVSRVAGVANFAVAENNSMGRLAEEGNALGHCVGGYCSEVASGQSKIFSLRDSRGRSYATVEVAPYATNIGSGRIGADKILQIKGPGNGALAPEMRPFIQDFLNSGKWGEVRDLENAGVAQNSHWLDRLAMAEGWEKGQIRRVREQLTATGKLREFVTREEFDALLEKTWKGR